MKACLVLQRRFAPVAHKIALLLRDAYGVDSFCGYVYLRGSYNFLTSQTDIPYTSLLLDEDIHTTYKNEPLDLDYLKELEKNYGVPHLWPYISVDRIVMYNMGVREYPYDTPPYTHEEMLRILQVKAKAIIAFLEKEKPDFVYMAAIGSMANMLLYQIAKKKGIRVFIGAETRIGRGYILSEDYRSFSFAETRFKELMRPGTESPKIGEAKKFIQEFRDKPSTYLYVMENFKNVGGRTREMRWYFSKKLLDSVSWYLVMTWRYIAEAKWNDYLEVSPISYLVDRIKRKVRTFVGFKDLYGTPNFEGDYAYFPLHLEPEIATLLLAPYWTNQINLAKQIAQSLPVHFKLYIKEHPAMLGYRTRKYYKEMKKIPNVEILDPNTSTFELTKHAGIIFTISGSVGWEAALLKKPVITFGDVFYNCLSMVKKCLEIEKLPEMIHTELTAHQHDEHELEQLTAALIEDSAESGLHEIWEKGTAPEKERAGLSSFVDLLASKLQLKKIHGSNN